MNNKPYIPEYKRLNRNPIPYGETTYSAVDDNIVDAATNNSGHIIDNNDFVDYDFLSSHTKEKKPPQKKEEPNIPDVGDYILMIFGKVVQFGALDTIESRVRAIIYEEDKDFSDQSVSVDDIVVLKRVPIKVGVFVGE